MRKLGLIGCGRWGKNLVREFHKLGILHIICDIQNLDYNIPITQDWNYFLNEIDMVCISLPAELHYEYTKKALLAHKDVFVEKPMTLNINQAQELVQLAHNNQCILMVGHLLQYHPAIQKIKEYLPKLGKVINITSNRKSWGTIREQENVLWSFAPHDLSIILSLVSGNIHQIVASGKSRKVYDIVNTSFYLDNIYVNINVSWLHPFKEQKLTIIGEQGSLIFDDVQKTLIFFKDNINENIEFDKTSPLELECQHFIECCETRQQPITNGLEGLYVLQIIDKIQQKLNNIQPKLNHQGIIDKGAIIGNNCRIWHHSHLTNTCQIGDNCSIGQNCYVAGILGQGCKLQNNVNIYLGVKCGNYVFFGPNSTTTNDLNPRAQYSKNGNYIETIIEDQVSIGANVVIRCGITLKKGCFIGCGSVVVKDCDEYGIYVGNPAKKIGIMDEYGNKILNN